VNQDPLGKQAHRAAKTADDTEVWAKELEDGSLAVGLFNRSEVALPVTAKWSDLGIARKREVRDLWREKSIGQFDGQFTTDVPRHGAVLVKISAPSAGG
jgi:alpha-galactosidase